MSAVADLVPFAAAGGLSTRAALLTAGAGLIALVLVLELIRRHRLQERYAVVWIASAIALLVLGVVGGISGSFAPIGDLIGIQDERFALVLVALVFVIVLLLHLTMVVSRLAEQNVRLAQELAVLRGEVEAERAAAAAPATGTDAAQRPASREPAATTRSTTRA
jgi:hypothetical protein